MKGETIHPIIERNVSKSSKVITEDYKGYRKLSSMFADYRIIKHSDLEYVVEDIHTNTIENFWSHFKQGIIGIYHKMSTKHLNHYIKEFQFCYNTRELNEAQRMNVMLRKVEGRLTYDDFI